MVWYDRDAIANILSLKQVKEKYKVEYDSMNRDCFVVTKQDGKRFEFAASPEGLYHFDTDGVKGNETDGRLLVNTVADHKARLTDEDYSRALVARKLQRTIGCPSTKTFLSLVANNMLPNSPVTINDIHNAELVFGPDVGTLRGKTVRQSPGKVRTIRNQLPMSVYDKYRDVTICVDVMFVNNLPMLVSISRKIKFGTIESIPNRKTHSLVAGIQHIQSLYRQAGFRVRTELMDGEFEPCRDLVGDLGITLNITSRNEHVGDIERYIRTIKERMRCIVNTLPFTTLPPQLVIEMAKNIIFWLNAFPVADGVSTTMSPREIITGH